MSSAHFLFSLVHKIIVVLLYLLLDSSNEVLSKAICWLTLFWVGDKEGARTNQNRILIPFLIVVISFVIVVKTLRDTEVRYKM